MSLEEKIALLEFQLELLFNNTELDRFIYECKLTRNEYHALMDIMDSLRAKLDNGEEISSNQFECAVYEIIPAQNGNYHFCELVTKLFAENGRWEEVFPALYGKLPKYAGISQ